MKADEPASSSFDEENPRSSQDTPEKIIEEIEGAQDNQDSLQHIASEMSIGNEGVNALAQS